MQNSKKLTGSVQYNYLYVLEVTEICIVYGQIVFQRPEMKFTDERKHYCFNRTVNVDTYYSFWTIF